MTAYLAIALGLLIFAAIYADWKIGNAPPIHSWMDSRDSHDNVIEPDTGEIVLPADWMNDDDN